MALQSIPFTRLRGGKLYLNLPIPADLRPRYATKAGKPRTHIVEALGTGDPAEGRRLARERQGHWEVEFAKVRRGHAGELPSAIRKARELRAAIAEARQEGNESGADALADLAQDHAERIEAGAGTDAAQQFYALATQPECMSLMQALESLCESPDITEGTKAKRTQQVKELLAFLKVPDCLPAYVTEARAVAYVEWLNRSSLGFTTKQDRLSGLQVLWKFLARRRQVPQGASPWTNHELTGKRKAGKGSDAAGKRAWKPEELATLLSAPDASGTKHYTRPLFRELYALGLTTGMRLDEIVSIRPAAVEAIKGGYWVNVEASKTDAGVRGIPIVHPTAVAILKRRLKAQKNAARSIFPECRPGGPDNKLSWHVQKALGRDRDALGFGPEVDFHSTRRSFMTLMEHAGADVVHVQRYVGHNVPTMMHRVYSEGASRDNLRRIAAAVKYPARVEAELAKLA